MTEAPPMSRQLQLVVGYGLGALCVRLAGWSAAASEESGGARLALGVIALVAAIPVGQLAVLRAGRKPLEGRAIVAALVGMVVAVGVVGLELWAAELLLNVFSGPVFVAADLLSWALIGATAVILCKGYSGSPGPVRLLCLAGAPAVGVLVGCVITAHLVRPDLYWGITMGVTPPLIAAVGVFWLMTRGRSPTSTISPPLGR